MARTRAVAEFLIRRRWTVDVARAALSALVASGLSVAAFAAREGLDAQRLYSWRRRLGPPEPVSPSFVEVTSAAVAPMEIVLRTGHVVRLPPSFDSAALVRLLEVLEQTPAC